MRIISGKARGTKIETINEITTRPTLDRVKESLFNIIQNKVSGANVIDLFAGSGALGIEALSRGAKNVVFCDISKQATNIIIKNLEKTHLRENAQIFNCDYQKCIEKIKGKVQFDVVFIDPPYKMDVAVKAAKVLLKESLVSENGIIIIETDEIERDLSEIEKILNDRVTIKDKRKYGRANLIFLEQN